jgi:hypothetical protein
MAAVRHVHIRNFRGISELAWSPGRGLNCLIGPGDSGKSTILDAIDLCLMPRRYAAVGEADFHKLDLTKSILIDVTVGALDDDLLDLDAYVGYLRGWSVDGKIEDEPGRGLEPVLTIRLEVGDDLVPRWRLFAERAEGRDGPRDLSYKDRTRIAPTRLGAFAEAHLAWGQRSVLNRIGDEKPDAGAALTQARAAAKVAFGDKVGGLFDETLTAVDAVATELAVDVAGGAKALLDTQQVSMGSGAVALHGGDDVPLRNLGLGSSRLVVAGLQKRAGKGPISLIDELEHGLEPYRIAQLLHVLGSKAEGTPQVFMTTHSPVVLRELSSEQIVVIRRPMAGGGQHRAIAVGADDRRQAALRACAEAFLTPMVLVCEGKTEVGLMRGMDLYCHESGKITLARCGVYPADGGGGEAPARALAFAEMGYETALFRDDDVPLGAKNTAALETAGVVVFQWPDKLATEAALFRACPDEAVPKLLEIAVDIRGKQSVEADIAAVSDSTMTLEGCLAAPGDPKVREVLQKASVRKDDKGRSRNWFKLIEPGERIGHEIIPQYGPEFEDAIREVIKLVLTWTKKGLPGGKP